MSVMSQHTAKQNFNTQIHEHTAYMPIDATCCVHLLRTVVFKPYTIAMMLTVLLLWTRILLSSSPAIAQFDPFLVGPLLAVNTAEQDRIILYDVATGSKRELNFGRFWHQVWDFSPDGCRILFTLNDIAAPGRLFSARLDGSDMRELVIFDALPPERWGVWEPDWSPDGTRIAFTMIRDLRGDDGTLERNFHIAYVAPQGGEPNFYSVTGDEHNPQWSPDGQWLAYISFEERVAGASLFATAEPTQVVPAGVPTPQSTLLREADLWMVNATGVTKFRLTNFPTGSLRAPRWSPNGELIGFTYAPSANDDQFWMIAAAPDALPTQLSLGLNLTLDMTWLPDSTALLVAARDLQGISENRLWRVPLVGNADTDATLFIDDPSLNNADYPRFSADGRWLAFRSAYTLILYEVATQTPTFVDLDTLGNTPPVWSPAAFTGETNCAR